jgi:hypothetical protein
MRSVIVSLLFTLRVLGIPDEARRTRQQLTLLACRRLAFPTIAE